MSFLYINCSYKLFIKWVMYNHTIKNNKSCMSCIKLNPVLIVSKPFCIMIQVSILFNHHLKIKCVSTFNQLRFPRVSLLGEEGVSFFIWRWASVLGCRWESYPLGAERCLLSASSARYFSGCESIRGHQTLSGGFWCGCHVRPKSCPRSPPSPRTPI